jgi:hypothetical protein
MMITFSMCNEKEPLAGLLGGSIGWSVREVLNDRTNVFAVGNDARNQDKHDG